MSIASVEEQYNSWESTLSQSILATQLSIQGQISQVIDATTRLKQGYFFTKVFLTFSPQKVHFFRPPLFPRESPPHHTSSLGYITKRAAAFRVWCPSALGWVKVVLRVVVTELGEKIGSGEKVFLGTNTNRVSVLAAILLWL